MQGPPSTFAGAISIGFCPDSCRRAADSLCPTLDAPKFTIIKTKGGHHFDGDYNFLANSILKASQG